jgi:hypothetical protein
MRRIAVAVLAVATLGAPAARAASGIEPQAAVVRALLDCRGLADAPSRLACYDEAAAAFERAEAGGDVVIVDREQARKVRRQAFGFTLPSISMFEKGESKSELENVDGKLASARQDASGHWVLKLEDGAVWRQIDSNELTRSPKSGMTVVIRKAALGSYLAAVAGQRAFRARRVE